jgi:F0F1-type ATP synthase assembly protein I
VTPWRSNDPPEIPDLLKVRPGETPTRPPDAKPPAESPLAPLMRVSTIGTEFAAAVAGMALLGWLLDRWWGTAPWALLTCALIGLLVAMFRFIRDARALSSGAAPKRKRGDKASGPGQPPPAP